MTERGNKVSDYFSLVKISHTIFSLPFALIGFTLAINKNHTAIDLRLLILVLLSIFFARNAAMGFNRYVDRDLDKKNPRTFLREIPGNLIQPSSALLFVLVNALFFMGITYFINRLCFLLSPIALLVILGYSFTKRFTFLSHLILGIGLGLAPVGAYLAVSGEFSLLPVLFSLAVIFWVAGFDVIYSLQDVEFDKNEKLRSIPESFGKRSALLISLVFHILSVGFIVICGFYGTFSYLYWIGAVAFTLILLYEHLIVRPDDLSKVNMAFATMNGMASVIFAAFCIADILIT